MTEAQKADRLAIANMLLIRFLDGHRWHHVAAIANLMGWSATKVRRLLALRDPRDLIESRSDLKVTRYTTSDAYLRDELLRLRAMERGVMARSSLKRIESRALNPFATKAATPQNEEQTKALLEASLKLHEPLDQSIKFVWVDTAYDLHEYDPKTGEGPILEHCNDHVLIEKSERVENGREQGVVVGYLGADRHWHFDRFANSAELDALGLN